MLGILGAIGFVNLRPASSRLFASDLKATLYQARYEAVKLNQPVAFLWDADAKAFVVRYDGSSHTVQNACLGDTMTTRKPLTDYRNVAVTVNIPTNGIVWLPNGQGRDCLGSPLANSNIVVTDGRSTRTVGISVGGKVSIQ